MSKTVDSRVVEMQFDNSQFERNVSTTMSTLDKLKQSLKFGDSSKGLDNLSKAAKNVDMNGLGNAVENVRMRFSALEVMGVTALANITNSAVNAGKRIVSALTIDPIKTGFQEYETQINAVQTILANTESKGSTLDDVNKALDTLNTYADKTIYNFTEMTRNIGTFTAAGIDLETSVNAIQGIANLAAVSGSTSQQASTAMYQLSQALASGTVKLMDWNSVVNAGMGGQVFQDALKETARVHGVAIDKMIEDEGSFRETLSKGWLTSEILTETLQKFTLSTEGLTDAEIEANREMLRSKGYTEDQIDAIFKLGDTATNAATKVKTFTQLWDVLKEAAQSGWSRTWRLIIGDFEEAKSLLTPLSETFTALIDKMSNWRNSILESALGKGFDKLKESITGILEPASNVADTIKDTVSVVGDLGAIVDEVISGKFGNGEDRLNALTKAGINYYTVQNKVNEKLGNSYRHSEDLINAQDKLLGKQGEAVEKTTEQTKATTELTDEEKNRLKTLVKATEAELKAKGYTEEQIEALKELGKQSEDLGIPLDEFIDNLDQINGRWLLLNSFKNIGKSIADAFKVIKGAWNDIFPPKTTEEIAEGLFKIIGAFHKFTSGLRLVDSETGELTETGDNLRRTFKGIFAILDVVSTILGGGFKIALKVISSILSYFNLDILDLTSYVGDAAVKFRDWFDSIFDVSGILDAIVPVISSVAKATVDWFDSFKNSEHIQKVAEYIKELRIGIKEWWSGLKDSEDLPKTIAEGIVNFISSIPNIISTVCSNIWSAITESFTGEISANPLNVFFDIIINAFSVAGQTVVELGKILLEKLNEYLSARGFEEISSDAIEGLINGLTGRATDICNAALEIGRQVLESVKDFLGIHSPSTEMEEVGTNTVDGFILGIQNGSSKIWETIKNLFGGIVEWIKGLDLGSVAAAIIGVFTAKTAYKAAGAIESFASPLEGVGDVLSSTAIVIKKSAKPIKKILNNTSKVVKSFSKVLKGVAFNLKAEGIKTLAESMLMLVGAIIILTFVDTKKLRNAVGVVAVLAAILTALAFAMNKLNSASASVDFKKGIDIKSLSSGLIGIGAALLLLALTVKMIGSLDPNKAKQGFLGLAGLIVAIGVVIAAFGLLAKGKSSENFDKLGKSMLKMAVALGIMAFVIKLLGKMDQSTLIQGGVAMVALTGIIVGLMAATKLISGSKNVDTIGGTLLKIALAIGVMAIVVNMLGKMDRETLMQGGIAIVAFSGIMVGLMAATKLINGSKNVDTIGGTLLKIALAIGVMAIVAKLLGGMDQEELIRGGLAITAFSGIIVGLMAATKLITGSKNVEKIGTALLAISGAIAIMAFVAFMLSMMSWDGLAKGTIMITAFAGIIVGLMAATKLISGSKNVDTIGKTLLSVAGAIAILAGIAVLISLVPEENLRKGLAAVTILATVMAGLIAATGLAKNCLGNIIALTVMISVVSGAVYLLSKIPFESAISSALILSGLIVVLTGCMAALSIVGKNAMNALFGVLALTSIAIPLLAFVGVLALMQNVQNAITNAIALSILTAAMTVLLIPLSLVGAVAEFALPGVLALTAMAVPLLAFVGILALMSGIQNGIENATALATLMTVIGDVLFKISIVAPLAVIGVRALSAMIGLITTLGILATGLGALVTHFPSLQAFLDTGIPIMEQLASGLGSIIASFITGFAGEIMGMLPQLGLCLSMFMVNVTPFIVGAKMIDESVLTGVGILSAAIVALTVADLIAGISSILQFGSSLADLGTELSQFMINALPFITTAAMITPEMLSGVKSLAETILILTAADVIQGLASFLTGGSSLETFAAQLPILGQGLAAFSTSLGAFTEDQLATVNCAANAVKTLAQASSEIPNTGGLLAQLVGDNDLGVFASQFPILGAGLNSFLSYIGTFTDEQVATVSCAAKAIKTLAQASSEIPNSGGLLAQLVGENDLGTFAAQFPALGTGLRGFLDNAGTLDESAIDTLTAGANAVKSLASAASTIPNEGGWISKLIGDNSLGTFADNFPKLGYGLAGFVKNIGTFTSAQVSTISSAVSAINALANLADSDLKGATKHLSDFGKDLPKFATDLATFCSGMPSTNSVTSAVNNIDRILSAVESIGNANSGVLSNFADNLKKVGKDAVKKFVEAFTSSTAKTDLKSAATTLAGNAVDGASSQIYGMESAGKDLGSGLVRGINAKQTAAYNAGYALGQKAVQGEKDGQKSNSPSKLTIQAGKWLGEGLVIGIKQMGNKVYSAGSNLGSDATKSISNAISNIANFVDSDIDINPTIRPVLDLSDVKSGASSIGRLLGAGSSISLMSDVKSIGSVMNRRSQNGVNDDVISAIDKLRKDVGNISTPSYNIGGITYDDGSNVSEAIKTLIRVAKIERRV